MAYQFRTAIGQNIYNQKYSHEGAYTWPQLSEQLVKEVLGCEEAAMRGAVTQDDIRELTQYVTDMKFIPGGRYLYYAGRPLKAYNNCFSGDTKLLTDRGWVRFDSVVEEEINVMSPVTGQYLPATMYNHGQQKVYKFTFAPVRGRSKVTYEVKATEDHKWPLLNGFTTRLGVGHVVPANKFSCSSEDSAMGFAHGFVFGDGNANGQLRLCASKDLQYLEMLGSMGTVTYPPSANGDPVVYFPWLKCGAGKLLPSTDKSPGYIAGFIRGWLAADGHDNRMLCSVNKKALRWFRKHAPMAGLVVSGKMRYQDRDISIGTYTYIKHRIYMQNFSLGGAWAGFKVIGKELIGTQDVYCPFEPVHNRIVIDHGIDTFNCYLLKGEEDTREEWGSLLKRASDCLMTGGGIGIDYSVFRAEGTHLKRTGGKASGPIPLMHSVNETGRNVMQGGSRRSAIYASLNWKHGDATSFLKMKDWHSMRIGNQIADGGHPYTVWHAKQEDFNYHAPLDMTNVSLNYDDAWLFMKNRDKDATFLQNVQQALRTGEPGFSFNFGSKQNETLRNACCEVVSADDSDCCNLGSVNMSRIESIDEFRDVVTLASKFLACGTLCGDVPFEKVRAVRDKNRRLGLGLMGIHEWLLKRGYGYEVTPELHDWLWVYREYSKKGADELCDALCVSRPVAYRAVAPTGTIGLISATSCGIEPLFAVAYKRRYLKGSHQWYYQYVIDGTAKALIDEYGLDPDTIDTAYSMSHEPEKRIKFQADVQDYVDMAISSTINLPEWGSSENNEDTVEGFASTLSRYAPRLRGFTVYPDGSRGGQPLTECTYAEAVAHGDTVYEDNDSCKGGICGL